MKRSLLSRYLRLEMFGIPIVLGLCGAALPVRAVTDKDHSVFYPVPAGALLVAAATLLFRAACKL